MILGFDVLTQFLLSTNKLPPQERLRALADAQKKLIRMDGFIIIVGIISMLLLAILLLTVSFASEAQEPVYLHEDNFTVEYEIARHSVVTVHSVFQGLYTGTGSGFHLGEGYFITNYHVINNATDVTLHTTVGASHAMVVGAWSSLDIALLYAPALGFTDKVILGTSKDLTVGQRVYNIGSPLGQNVSLGAGFITGLDRTIGLPPSVGIIQIGTGVTSGNSGGPLFNSNGEVIGIVYAGIPGTNLGFAIPIDLVREPMKKLINDFEEKQ